MEGDAGVVGCRGRRVEDRSEWASWSAHEAEGVKRGV